MNSLFLPDGASTLIPCREPLDKGVNLLGSNEIRIWLKNLPYLRSVQYCGPEDMTFDNIKPEGTEQTVTNVNLNEQNFLKIFDVTLKDWYSRNEMTSVKQKGDEHHI